MYAVLGVPKMTLHHSFYIVKKKRFSDTIFRYYCLCLPGICFGEIFLALKQCPKTHPLPHRQFLDVMSPSRLNFLHISIGRFTDTWLCVYVQCMYVQYCKLGKLRCWNIFVKPTTKINLMKILKQCIYGMKRPHVMWKQICPWLFTTSPHLWYQFKAVG